MSFKTPDEIIRDALNDELIRLIARLTPEQEALFAKVYPYGNPAQTPWTVDRLKSAIELCQRTIKKNEAGR